MSAPQRLADFIPVEDMSTIHQIHYVAEVVEAVEVVFGVAEGAGATLASMAAKTSAEKLVEELLELGGFVEGVLTVAAPVAAIFAEFAALGLGYADALEDISEEHATRGFALGVVLAVGGNQPAAIAQDNELWRPFVQDNPFISAAKGIALKSYQMGMIAGVKHGRELTQVQRKNFWFDLIAADRGAHVDWESQRNPSNSFYEAAAVVFRREHLRKD